MISLRDVLYSFLCLSFALSLAGGKQQHEAGPQIDVIFPFFSSRLPLCGTDFGQVTLCPGCVFKGYRMPYDATGCWQIENNKRFCLDDSFMAIPAMYIIFHTTPNLGIEISKVQRLTGQHFSGFQGHERGE